MAKVRSNEYYTKNAHRIVGHLEDLSPAIYRTVRRNAKGHYRAGSPDKAEEVAIVAVLLSGYPEILGYICGLIDMSRGERAANPPKKAKPTYKVTVGDLGAIYNGTSKTAAEMQYDRLVHFSLAGDQLDIFTGSDVTLSCGSKILAHHRGHGIRDRRAVARINAAKRKPNHHRTGILSEDYPADPYRRDLATAYDPYDAYWRSPNGRRANTGDGPNPKRAVVVSWAVPKIRDRQEFRLGNLFGFDHDQGPGWLLGGARSEYLQSVREAKAANDSIYVVYCYYTPIAWWTAGRGWMLVDVTDKSVYTGSSASKDKEWRNSIEIVRAALGHARVINPRRRR